MYEEIKNPDKNQEKITKKQEREKLYEVARRGLSAIFKTYADSKERTDSIKEGVIRMSKYLESSDKILADLDACADIRTKNEFIEKVFAAAKPLIDLKIDNPNIFISEGENDRKSIEVNEALSYEIKGDIFSIHIVPKEVFEDIFEKIEEGLKKLAEIINKNEGIKTIEAESWIVAKHPKIVENFGFTINNNEKGKAHIIREEFLNRYLDK